MQVEEYQRRLLLSRPIQRVVNVTAADTLLAAVNPKRRALILNNNDAYSQLRVAVGGPWALDRMLTLFPVFPQLQIWGSDWGKLVEADWHGSALLAGAPGGVQTPFAVFTAAASGAAVATLISQAIPAGSTACLTSATCTNFVGGAPTIALQWVHSGNTITLMSGTTPMQWATPVTLFAADTIKWACTASVPASTVDVTLGGYFVSSAGGVPTSMSVGVIELEG